MATGMVILLGSIAAEVVATLALRASGGFTRPAPTALSLAGYGLALWGLSVASKTVPLGVGYTLWAGLGTAGALVAARFVYGERLSAGQWFGVALVLAGAVAMQAFAPRGAA